LVVNNGDDLIACGRVTVDISGGPRDSVGTDGEGSNKGGRDGVCGTVVSVRRSNGRGSALSGSGDEIGRSAIDDRRLVVGDNNREAAAV